MTEYWQDSKETLAERGAHLLETGVFSDVEFLLYSGENVKKIPAHKLILSMGSPVFEAMFLFPFEEKEPIPVTDIAPNIFSKMLHYLYTDEFSVGRNIDEGLEFYYAAEKYSITKLKKECNIYFESVELHPENICSVFEGAELLNIESLRKRCITFISENTTDVLKSSGFLNAKQQTVHFILEMENVSVTSEVEFFKALFAWGRAECCRKNFEADSTSIRTVLNPLIPHIRFLVMSIEEFTNAMNDTADIFASEETLQIYMKIARLSTKHFESLPSWCNNSPKRRGILPDIVLCIDEIQRVTTFRSNQMGKNPRIILKSFLTDISLESYNDGLIIKGMTLHWITLGKQEKECLSCKGPKFHSYRVEALNPTTGVKVNMENIVATDEGVVKLMFPKIIPVASDEKLSVLIHGKFGGLMRSQCITEGRYKTSYFNIIMSCETSSQNEHFIINELIYSLKCNP